MYQKEFLEKTDSHLFRYSKELILQFIWKKITKTWMKENLFPPDTKIHFVGIRQLWDLNKAGKKRKKELQSKPKFYKSWFTVKMILHISMGSWISQWMLQRQPAGFWVKIMCCFSAQSVWEWQERQMQKERPQITKLKHE